MVGPSYSYSALDTLQTFNCVDRSASTNKDKTDSTALTALGYTDKSKVLLSLS